MTLMCYNFTWRKHNKPGAPLEKRAKCRIGQTSAHQGQLGGSPGKGSGADALAGKPRL
jgi:hypothetical protein